MNTKFKVIDQNLLREAIHTEWGSISLAEIDELNGNDYLLAELIEDRYGVTFADAHEKIKSIYTRCKNDIVDDDALFYVDEFEDVDEYRFLDAEF